MLSRNEILVILDAISKAHNVPIGYSDEVVEIGGESIKVGALQAKLSIMLEMVS